MKPQASKEVIFREAPPSLVRTKRIARQIGGLFSLARHPRRGEDESISTEYELKRAAAAKAIRISRALKDIVPREDLRAGVVVLTPDLPYDMRIRAKVEDTPDHEIVNAEVLITSLAGTTTRMELHDDEVPPARNHEGLIRPKASMKILDTEGSHSFGPESYDRAFEAPELIEAFDQVATDLERTGTEQALVYKDEAVAF